MKNNSLLTLISFTISNKRERKMSVTNRLFYKTVIAKAELQYRVVISYNHYQLMQLFFTTSTVSQSILTKNI